MPWIYLLGALAFPPVFILWRPRERLSPGALRFRLGASIVVVWMLAILWSLGSALNAGTKEGIEIDERNYTDPVLGPRQRDLTDENRNALPATLPARPPKEPGDPDEVSGKKDEDIDWGWSYEGPQDTRLTLTLGWIPGLMYAGLLLLARRSFEVKEEERQGFPIVDDDGWGRR